MEISKQASLLIETTKAMYKGTDKYLAPLWTKELPGRKVGCRSCMDAYCCMQSTVAFLPEALLIASEILSMPPAPSSCSPTPWQDFAYLREFGEKMESMSRAKYFDLKIQCPFLDENKRCSIYSVRPMSCRKYFAACDSQDCSPDHKEPIPIVNVQEVDMLVVSTMLELQNLFGIPLALGTAPRMIGIAGDYLMHGDFDKLAEEKWLDVMNDEFVADLKR